MELQEILAIGCDGVRQTVIKTSSVCYGCLALSQCLGSNSAINFPMGLSAESVNRLVPLRSRCGNAASGSNPVPQDIEGELLKRGVTKYILLAIPAFLVSTITNEI